MLSIEAALISPRWSGRYKQRPQTHMVSAVSMLLEAGVTVDISHINDNFYAF